MRKGSDVSRSFRVFVAVNLGEASGDRDIDFSLNLNRLRYFASPTDIFDIFDSIQLFVEQYKIFPYSRDKLHDTHETIRLYIARVKRMALFLALPTFTFSLRKDTLTKRR